MLKMTTAHRLESEMRATRIAAELNFISIEKTKTHRLEPAQLAVRELDELVMSSPLAQEQKARQRRFTTGTFEALAFKSADDKLNASSTSENKSATSKEFSGSSNVTGFTGRLVSRNQAQIRGRDFAQTNHKSARDINAAAVANITNSAAAPRSTRSLRSRPKFGRKILRKITPTRVLVGAHIGSYAYKQYQNWTGTTTTNNATAGNQQAGRSVGNGTTPIPLDVIVAITRLPPVSSTSDVVDVVIPVDQTNSTIAASTEMPRSQYLLMKSTGDGLKRNKTECLSSASSSNLTSASSSGETETTLTTLDDSEGAPAPATDLRCR